MSASARQRGNRLNIWLIFIFLSGLLFAGCGHKQSGTAGQDQLTPRQLALQYLIQNHLDEAEASFVKAIQLSPDDVLNYEGLARLYFLQKNYDAAEGQANAGLKIKQDDASLKLILADVYNEKGDTSAALRQVKGVLAGDPKNVRAWYKLAVDGPAGPNETWKKNYLIKVLGLVPANIVPRLQLAEIFAGNKQTDSALFYLQGVKKIASGFSVPANTAYQNAVSLLYAGQSVKALPYIRQFHTLMQTSSAYAYGDDEIDVPKMLAGYPEFNASQNVQEPGATGNSLLSSIRFTDATDATQLGITKTINAQNAVLAVTDQDGAGNLYLYTSFIPEGSSQPKHYLLVSKNGTFEKCDVIGGIDHEGQDLDAAFADYDNDGYQDLFVATTKGIIVYRNNGDGTFSKVTDDIGLRNTTNANKMLFADFDQDGDLDMYVAEKNGNKFFRNNGDGTFTENDGTMGLTGDVNGTTDMDFGDWDSDGDLDIVALKKDGGVQLFDNKRHSNFKDISASVGLQDIKYAGTTVCFGDYNNDGLLDIFIAGGPDGKCTLLKNTGNGFVIDPVSNRLSKALHGIKVADAAFLDFDNDGHQDLLVAGVNEDRSKSGVKLFHNDTTKGFRDMSYLLPKTVMQASRIKIADFDSDGDEDIFLAGTGGAQLIRNDGGNLNNFIQVQLVGLSYGNSKNNRLGIGAQVELKAGDLYQRKTVTSGMTEFGVGTRSKFDAVRIIWPNGVPQIVADPTRKDRILEQEQLKGSCPFLFTWDGKKYEFIKDMMWRSALGMPLAVHGTDTTYASADVSKEYLLIPGEKLKPQNGLYTIKITEELWEAIFFDEIKLIAVDHPDSVDAYADERFVAPPYPGEKVYTVSNKYLPVSAVDGKGNNVLPKLSAYDFQYVSNFPLGKFQGLAQDHDLVLDLGNKAESDSLYLFLRGWIFPTDASINTELTQTDKYKIHPPCLQVINKKGEWQTVIPDLGFPMGRDKMVIANLSGKFLTANDRRVRIRTNMQIYWDQVFFSTGNSKAPVKIHDLKMVDADLNYRGYSASYRKGGPYGPEWFDFYHVTTGQKWRDLTGNYTRYGDVTPLLQQADDKYVIADGGDVVTINFDEAQLPPLQKGWKRDFLIYSEGWVKDGDLNTADGQTVGPLPYHAMPAYPYGNAFAYPRDKEHREYRLEYNTRKVTTDDFKNALKPVSLVTAQRSAK